MLLSSREYFARGQSRKYFVEMRGFWCVIEMLLPPNYSQSLNAASIRQCHDILENFEFVHLKTEHKKVLSF